MFGIAMEQVKLRNKYTTTEFYDRIADVCFEAGFPTLVKYGPDFLIVFPEQDEKNQVQIQSDDQGRIFVKRTVAPIPLGRSLEREPDYGYFALRSQTKKRCEELVKSTADQLCCMGL